MEAIKFDYLKELKEMSSKTSLSMFDYAIWLDTIFDEIKEFIDGEQTSPGETTPEQNIVEFLSQQNLFNPGTFNKNVLIKEGTEVISDLLHDYKKYCEENGINMKTSIQKFTQNQITFLPSACQLIVERMMVFE